MLVCDVCEGQRKLGRKSLADRSKLKTRCARSVGNRGVPKRKTTTAHGVRECIAGSTEGMRARGMNRKELLRAHSSGAIDRGAGAAKEGGCRAAHQFRPIPFLAVPGVTGNTLHQRESSKVESD